MKKLIIFMLLLSNISYADQAINLDKGTPAPFPGVLFDKEKAEKTRDELIEKDGLVRTNESLEKSIKLYRGNEDILSGQKDILLKQNIELTKTLNESRSVSGWEKVGFFILGVVVTGGAVYGASKLIKQ